VSFASEAIHKKTSTMSVLNTYNTSVLVIPAYYLLSVFPHSYALVIATQGKLGTWV
jgi:hypothetical protein